MADVRRTPVSNYPAYYGAGLISGINEAVSKPFGYENDPVRALTDLLGVPAIVKTLENTAYGMPNIRGTGIATQLRPEAKETVGTLLPATPGAARLAARGAVAGGKYIAPKVGGLLDDYATKTGLQMYVYRPTSPSNPDPLVGTQFKREDLGGLIDKNITDLSNKQGASISFVPWDNSSRNMKITQVSGVDIPPVITHGGQGYARDIEHIRKGIGGASGKTVAGKIKIRDERARAENLAAGGTGEVIHTPITMAEFSENYSVQPTQVLLGLIDRTPNNQQAVSALNQSIRNLGIFKGTGDKRRQVFPFKDFAGVDTEAGRLQLLDRTSKAGDLRKAFVSRAYLKSKKKDDFNFQREFGFNAEDIQNAILAPDLVGVGRGYGGNTLISSGKQGLILQPSRNATYDTDMANMEYLGSLGYNVPVEVFMGSKFTDLAKEFAGKKGDIRSMTIGAIEKRKEGVSAMIDEPMLRRIEEYRKGLLD